VRWEIVSGVDDGWWEEHNIIVGLLMSQLQMLHKVLVDVDAGSSLCRIDGNGAQPWNFMGASPLAAVDSPKWHFLLYFIPPVLYTECSR